MKDQQSSLFLRNQNIRSKVFRVVFAGIILFTTYSCKKENMDMQKVITTISIEEMGHQYLPEFDLVRSWPKFNEGREYNFINADTSESIYIRVGLFKSREYTEKIAREYCSSISVYLTEGPHNGVTLGDNFWWFNTYDSDSLINLIFTRKNALFIMGAHGGYIDIKNLAIKIDNDILGDADYILLDSDISVPVIDSIKASRPVIAYGETVLITVFATSPDNLQLQYNSVGLTNSKYRQVFVEVALPGFVPEPIIGSHIYRFTVINEKDVLSEVAEFELKITE